MKNLLIDNLKSLLNSTLPAYHIVLAFAALNNSNNINNKSINIQLKCY